MPAFYRRPETARAPQSEQVWVGLSLNPLTVRLHVSVTARRSGDSLMISGMILLVVATGIIASAIAGMLNDRRRLP
jgi:hypothetical protein